MRKVDGFDHDAYCKRLRLLREAISGENQIEFAKRIGVPFKRWSNWERGYPMPREAAFLLKDQFGVSVEWLWWGWPDNMAKQSPKLWKKLQAAGENDKARAATMRKMRKLQAQLTELGETLK